MVVESDVGNVTICRRNKALVKELSTPPPGANDLYFHTQHSQSTWGQFKSCLWKQWWTYWRSPDYNLVRYFFTLAAALMIGTIFWDVGSKRFVFYLDRSTNTPFASGTHRKTNLNFCWCISGTAVEIS